MLKEGEIALIVGPEGLDTNDQDFRRMTINDQQLSEFRKLHLGVLTLSSRNDFDEEHYFYKEDYLTSDYKTN